MERDGRPADHRQDRRVRDKLVDTGAEGINQTAERHRTGKGLGTGTGRAALAVAEGDRDGIAWPQRGIAHAQLHDLFPGPHAEIGVKTCLQPGAVRRLHGHAGIVGGCGVVELRAAPVGGGMEGHAKRAAIVNAVCADPIRQGPGPDTPGDSWCSWCEPSQAKARQISAASDRCHDVMLLGRRSRGRVRIPVPSASNQIGAEVRSSRLPSPRFSRREGGNVPLG